MSGYDSIMDWADENIPLSDYDTFEDWQDALRKQFDEDERLPIDQIFDASDWNSAEQLWIGVHDRKIKDDLIDSELQKEIDSAKHPTEKLLEKQDPINEETFSNITINPPQQNIIEEIFETIVSPEDLIPNTKLLSKLGGFIKKLFGR